MTMDEIKCSIGKEGVQGSSLSEGPFRAFFTWLRDGQIVNTADFSKSELAVEIARLVAAGEESAPFKEALKRLDLY